MSELSESSVESRMIEIESAARNTEAQGRLAEIRAQLGLAPAATDAPAEAEIPTEATTPAPEPTEGTTPA